MDGISKYIATFTIWFFSVLKIFEGNNAFIIMIRINLMVQFIFACLHLNEVLRNLAEVRHFLWFHARCKYYNNDKFKLRMLLYANSYKIIQRI